MSIRLWGTPKIFGLERVINVYDTLIATKIHAECLHDMFSDFKYEEGTVAHSGAKFVPTSKKQDLVI